MLLCSRVVLVSLHVCGVVVMVDVAGSGGDVAGVYDDGGDDVGVYVCGTADGVVGSGVAGGVDDGVDDDVVIVVELAFVVMRGIAVMLML